MEFWYCSIYVCINCQNRLSVDIAATVARRLVKAKLHASGAGRAVAGISRADVALEPINKRVRVFFFKRIEILD